MLKEAYQAKELCPLLGVSFVSSIIRRAERENWPYRMREGRGGGKEYPAARMPESVRLAIAAAEERRIVEQEKAQLPAVQPVRLPALTDAMLEKAMLDDKRRDRALAKADLVRMYIAWQEKNGATVTEKKVFVQAYLDGHWPRLLAECGKKISWKSLERWKLHLHRAESVIALADKRGIAHKGRSMLCEQHHAVILGQILNPNAPNIAQCVRKIHERCKAEGLHLPSETTIRRYVEKFMAECYGEWIMWREGKKAWNDKCAISLLRNWNLVQVGDIVIADGHILNFETINPETGKPKRMTLLLFYDGASNHPLGWEIMANENTACISSAFRRTCLLLGKFPRVVYIDNGKAFRSEFFEGCNDFEQAGFLGLYRDLGCEVIHAWPYHGESKTIERFFGSFHDMEVFVPSYVGNCIDAKPARLMRNEVTHRKLYEKLGGRPLTLAETHKAVATWFAEYANRSQYRTHLAGKTPSEVFQAGVGPGVDEDRLVHMMLKKKIKTITKNGFRHLGHWYWHEALASRRHEVMIRYDDQFSRHTAFVYTLDGDFLCESRDRDHYKIAAGLHPAAKALGTPEQVQDLSDAIKLKKGQEKLARASMQAMCDAVVIPEVQRIQAQIINMEEHKRIALPAPEKRMSAEDIAKFEAAKEKARVEFDTKSAEKYKPAFLKRDLKNEMDKYKYLFHIRYEQNIELVPQDAAWMNVYEKSREYETYCKRHYETLKEVFRKRQKTA
jgi:putative transposase